MRVESIHRWQWALIALIIGFLIASVRNHYTDETSGYGDSMNGQQQFEGAILSHDRLATGELRPLFYKLVVFEVHDPTPTLRSPEEMKTAMTAEQKKKHDLIKKPSDQMAYLRELAQEEADGRRTYTIAGLYYSGRVTQDPKDNQWKKLWRPYKFIAPNPYKPTRQFSITGPVPPLKPTFLDRLQVLAEKMKLKEIDGPETVVAYMHDLKALGRIEYTYQWWKAPRLSLVLWMAGCVIVIGGIWPTVINLLVYGTFSRPREEKADLSKT